MATKIYVGNLPWRISNEELEVLFASHGQVLDAKIVTDRETGRSRGFGFVTMEPASAAQAAIAGLSGHTIEGRNLVVNEAHEQGSRSGGSRGPYGPRHDR